MDQFLQIDDRIKELNEQIKKLRERRNLLEAHIIKNNIQSSQYKIIDAKHVEPVTFKYLERTLGEIIQDKRQLQQVIDHIKQRRQTTNAKEVRRLD